MPASRFFRRGSLLLVAAALTACAQQGGPTMPAAPLALQNNVVSPNAAPPACKGQTNGKDYASLNVTLSTKGGSYCVPAISGFGGSIFFPKAKPAVKATLISSTANYKNFPQLGTGTAIFYLQLNIAGGTSFGNEIKPTGGLTASTITSGKPYTAFGQATISGAKIKFGPCYSTASKGKYGGVIGSLGGLLEYAAVPGKTDGFIEIYAGAQTKTKC